MKKYLLFYHDCYSPNGGMQDFYGDNFNDIEEAKHFIKNQEHQYDIYELVEHSTMKLVANL